MQLYHTVDCDWSGLDFLPEKVAQLEFELPGIRKSSLFNA